MFKRQNGVTGTDKKVHMQCWEWWNERRKITGESPTKDNSIPGLQESSVPLFSKNKINPLEFRHLILLPDLSDTTKDVRLHPFLGYYHLSSSCFKNIC